MNIVPSRTNGTTSAEPAGSVQLQTTLNEAALAAVICVSGLKPCASQPRRQVSQSCGGGLARSAFSTGLKWSSGLGSTTGLSGVYGE